jgi:hypothetical protein
MAAPANIAFNTGEEAPKTCHGAAAIRNDSSMVKKL